MKPDWSKYTPADVDSPLFLDHLWGGRHLYTVIAYDYPDHGNHFIKRIGFWVG